jgi:hypothetical protein
MRLRFDFKLFILLAFLTPAGLWAQKAILANQLGFYDDNEEFNEPFYASGTLEGLRFQSALALATGSTTGWKAGFFVDNREEDASWVKFWPLLSFEYHAAGTRLIMGTIENQDRHGFLEPLENETLSLTRPVEYGLQWLQKDEGFHSDVFLDWQQVDQPGQDEIFDYGAVLTADLSPQASIEMQLHGYHEGGRIFNIRVVNNYNPALGLRFKEDLGFWGESRLDLFAVTSSDFEGKFDIGPNWGRGLYARGSVTPGGLVELYGLYWNAQDFFSEEGDPNYNSLGLNPTFARPNRVYVEAGLKEDFILTPGIQFQARIKSGWADEFWGWAFHLTAEVPFDMELPFQGQKNQIKEGPDAL